MTHRYRQAKKVTLIGAASNALLGFIKLISGWLFQSHALMADGIHSFSDLFTDVMVLFAAKFGSQDADDSHPYGHQRIETAATLLLALLLSLTGIAIAWDAFDALLRHHPLAPNEWALPIAVLSVLINEWLFHYTRSIGKKIASTLIIANAWHHRTDAASSAIVAFGLFASLLGFSSFDSIAAIIVGAMIIKMGINYGWNSVKELVDTAVDPSLLLQIEHIIQQSNGVLKIHQLRTRSMANDILIDVHILVSPRISVSEGHFIAQNVHHRLISHISRVKDVTVHVDPEDDENERPSLHLPDKKTLEKTFLSPWKASYPCINDWIIHYLKGTITIDLICSGSLDAVEAMEQELMTEMKKNPVIHEIHIINQIKSLRQVPD